MLAELAQANERRRADLVLGWSLAGLDDLIGMFREAEGRGDDVAEELEAMTSARTRLLAYAQRENIRARHWRPAEGSRAEARL
jgi:hypothetical protein